jgi:hypothetical protein
MRAPGRITDSVSQCKLFQNECQGEVNFPRHFFPFGGKKFPSDTPDDALFTIRPVSISPLIVPSNSNIFNQ